MHIDKFIGTTEERAFDLEIPIAGTLIRFQPSYDCTNDSIAYHATSLVKLASGDTITVYSACEQHAFEVGASVIIAQANLGQRPIQSTKREIIEQFAKKHPNHPYWKCISCKYSNTVATLKAANK